MDVVKSVEVIYHKRNQEVLTTSDRAEMLKRVLLQRTPITEFESDHSQYGHFHNRVYDFTGGLVIFSVWQPTSGYSWSEEIITVIRIPQIK